MPVGLLALTPLACGTVRRLFRPIGDIRAGVLRHGAGDCSSPDPVRRQDDGGDLATQVNVNVMVSSLQRRLERQYGQCPAISPALRSPLTRARLHAE